MELRVGDKVRFLNEQGGGKIARIIDKHFVEVLTEDGFEVPVLRKEVIVIPGQRQDPEIQVAGGEHKTEQTPIRQPARGDRQKESKGIYLAWVRPPGTMIQGEVDLYIINHTPHDILFNVLTHDDEAFSGFEYGSLAPGKEIMIQAWCGNVNQMILSGIVQAMFHPLTSSRKLEPLDAEFRIRASRLMKEDAYRVSPFFNEPAVLVHLGYEGEKMNERGATDTRQPERGTPSFLDKHLQPEGHAIIDLHLEQLVENSKGITPAEALQIQMSYFTAALDAAMSRGIGKIVFIHGVGNGILKSEIRKRIDELEQVLYYDAPMKLYGVGATEVRIPTDVH